MYKAASLEGRSFQGRPALSRRKLIPANPEKPVLSIGAVRRVNRPLCGLFSRNDYTTIIQHWKGQRLKKCKNVSPIFLPKRPACGFEAAAILQALHAAPAQLHAKGRPQRLFPNPLPRMRTHIVFPLPCVAGLFCLSGIRMYFFSDFPASFRQHRTLFCRLFNVFPLTWVNFHFILVTSLIIRWLL